ncbi:hypothetical protein [Ileibacterium valens]|uniref:Uncharacterized protein n=1 Tax=Ileibacterium valens TaxID=1862668 RepID=A0A1U7NJ33_9FIRM|nr:hypothetical protein [Ileibacterium valens]OLU37777.1 hypothetical protein BO224_10260 [Erysipelotrichaceae bacterium NYU-BL-E8]OLU42379.1 hypothetical protein BM735_02400 [Erysipelotrichaceae bacterium NYU-BL-F16]OLU43045.1 hypothetical protein BO222_00730 [Ileibacterium valens]
MHLSIAIRKQRSKYYKAFEICENELNCSDLTPFVLFFLNALEDVLEHETMVLKEKNETFKKYTKKIFEVIKGSKKADAEFLTFLAAQTLFSVDGARKIEIAQALNKSDN